MRTCRARSVRCTTKSSTRRPSRSSAWARIPDGPGSTSPMPSSGTKRRTSETKARLLAAWRISVRPVRQKRPARRQVPGQVRLESAGRRRAAERSGRRRGRRPSAPRGRAAPRRRSSASGGRRGRGGLGPGPGRCWRGPARAAPDAGAGSRRGTGRSAARPGAPAATASRSDQAPAQLTTKPASVDATLVLDRDARAAAAAAHAPRRRWRSFLPPPRRPPRRRRRPGRSRRPPSRASAAQPRRGRAARSRRSRSARPASGREPGWPRRAAASSSRRESSP